MSVASAFRRTLSGPARVLDNDDAHTSIIPGGTILAPGGYYLLEEAAFGFGLGSADSARLFDPAGTLIDSYSWTAHATTTYGRCPNGSAGKALHYQDGTGNTDAEGVTFAGSGSAGGIYVSTERNNDVNGISRNSILRFDPSAAGTSLSATHEWNLTADLPAVGANLGIEAITWIPDAFLISRGFIDQTRGPSIVYNPADYPNHGTGLFFVGLEANGMVYAYALDHVGGGFTRVATIATGLAGVMDLQFDRELNDLWAVCDDGCLGRSVVLRIAPGSGVFAVAQLFERPAGMPNLNNEGFAFAPLVECVGNRRPAFWSDDSETGGHAIRAGTLTCTPF